MREVASEFSLWARKLHLIAATREGCLSGPLVTANRKNW